jgi:hypothetical protein
LQGFKAQVTREPTDIVVKIPTPPPAQEQFQQQYVTVSLIFLGRTAETCLQLAAYLYNQDQLTL